MVRSKCPFPIFIANYDPQSTLLAHLDGLQGATSYTAETGQIVTLGGGAVIGTTYSKFGTSAIDFGYGVDNRWAELPASTNWVFPGDFTIDMQVKATRNPAASIIIANQNLDQFQSLIDITNSGTASLLWIDSYGVVNFGPYLPWSLTSWNHIAHVRYGNQLTTYINGVTCSTATRIGTMGQNVKLQFGFRHYGSNYHQLWGQMDEIRIIKGLAVWTSNFIPPTAPYQR